MNERLFLLSDRKAAANLSGARLVQTEADIRNAYGTREQALWLAFENPTKLFTRALHLAVPRHRILVLDELTSSPRELLDALFAVVVAPSSGTRLLATEELLEVLQSEKRKDLFIGVRFVSEDNVLVLYRGDLKALVVKVSSFKKSRKGPKPNPKRAEVVDYGQTLRLGAYEVASDAILYEFDTEARRRMKKNRLDEDKTLGAAIRRLRLQKNLSQNDFEPEVTAKTIGRIERGESIPHGSTLANIAKRLGVRADELKSY